jgi:hypothetical protein
MWYFIEQKIDANDPLMFQNTATTTWTEECLLLKFFGVHESEWHLDCGILIIIPCHIIGD